MIIIGYPGIGKSTIAGKFNCIDLESSLFFDSNGVRPPKWFDYYYNIATSLSNQGYVVLISSHSSIINKLKNSNEQVVEIIPSPVLKYEWINKLKLRAEQSKSDKDFRAYLNCKDNFDSNISNMMNNKFDKFIIKDIDYKLDNIIKQLVEKYHNM